MTQTGEPKLSPFDCRRAGILLHPTSLPSRYGGGDLGQEARNFIEFLVACRQTVWQVLPLGPVHEDKSPYQSLSVHAGNTRLISIDELLACGWLPADVHDSIMQTSADDELLHQRMLDASWAWFSTSASADARDELQQFQTQSQWLHDYVLFVALREEHQHQGWVSWPEVMRDRDAGALKEAAARLRPRLDQLCYEQFVFFRQWQALKCYANERGVLIFGDIPIFVAHDSADVWCQPELFELDADGMPKAVAGVPPDYFSETGQRWGNPLYRWEVMAKDDYAWWRSRLQAQHDMVDLLRIDHFRGFESYWEVPAADDHAMNGRWLPGPGADFFNCLAKYDVSPALVAEDLGVITPEVEALRDEFELPGMKILQFAFDGSADNFYLPHQHIPNCVVYTGTHDNDTSVGWYENLDEGMRDYIRDYLGVAGAGQVDVARLDEAMPWPLIRAALASPARLAIIPFQDVMGLDGAHRMNVPGIAGGNWCWQFDWDWLDEAQCNRLAHMTRLYGRN